MPPCHRCAAFCWKLPVASIPGSTPTRAKQRTASRLDKSLPMHPLRRVRLPCTGLAGGRTCPLAACFLAVARIIEELTRTAVPWRTGAVYRAMLAFAGASAGGRELPRRSGDAKWFDDMRNRLPGISFAVCANLGRVCVCVLRDNSREAVKPLSCDAIASRRFTPRRVSRCLVPLECLSLVLQSSPRSSHFVEAGSL